MRTNKKKKNLADWIRRKVGAPIVQVLLDQTQIDDAIDEACDLFAEFGGGVGNEDSILLINPELVYYDGTGKQSQPGPSRGKWRRPLPPFLQTLTIDQLNNLTPTEYEHLKIKCGTTSTSATPECCPPNYNTTKDKFGGVDSDTSTNEQIDPECCPPESDGPGPGWCGNSIQDPHCYTETNPGDPLAIGPYWTIGDTTTKPLRQGYLYKTVYDVDESIIAVGNQLDHGMFGFGSMGEDGALFSPMGMMLSSGGSWGMMNSGRSVDNRYGNFWPGNFMSGGFDIVSLQMSLQYLEMFRQMFTVKMMVKFNALNHKVALSPAPTTSGVVAIACTKRIVDEALYNNVWVKNYALALVMVNIGMNSGRYTNATFPGGASINTEMYLTRGDALREKLEKQLYDDHNFSEPCDFFVG